MGKLESGRSHLSQKLPNKAFCMITGIMHCKATQKVTGFSSHFFISFTVHYPGDHAERFVRQFLT